MLKRQTPNKNSHSSGNWLDELGSSHWNTSRWWIETYLWIQFTFLVYTARHLGSRNSNKKSQWPLVQSNAIQWDSLTVNHIFVKCVMFCFCLHCQGDDDSIMIIFTSIFCGGCIGQFVCLVLFHYSFDCVVPSCLVLVWTILSCLFTY